MVYLLSWFIVLVLLGLWSLSAWALHGIAAWAVSSTGSLSGVGASVGTLDLPGWLEPWVPPALVQPFADMARAFAPAIDAVLQAVPALASLVTFASWVVWGVGSALLLLLGAGLHVLIALWRRRRAGRGSGHDGGAGRTPGPALAAPIS